MRHRLFLGCLFVLILSLGLQQAQEPASKTTEAQAGPKRVVPTRFRKLKAIKMQSSLAEASKSKAKFKNPEESAYKSVHELTVSTKSFPTPNADEVGAAQFQLLCYNNQPVGPTIRVRRGTTFHIRVKNDLKDKAPGKHPANQTGINETPFEFCTTNLHTHGLHVSPGARADTAQNISLGDNIFKEIKPGDELTYEYTLGADHQSGTNWYHPHKHGSVAYQLSNGLAGALIVDGRPGDGIADLEDIPEIAGAKEQILVFQLYTFGVDDKKVGRIDAYQPPPSTGTIYNVKPDSNSCRAISRSRPRRPARCKRRRSMAC